MQHPENSRDLWSTHPDNNSTSIMSCRAPLIVSEMHVDLQLPADMLLEEIPGNIAANGGAIMAFFNN